MLKSMSDEQNPVSPSSPVIISFQASFQSCCPVLPPHPHSAVPSCCSQHMTLAVLPLTIPYLMSRILSAFPLSSLVNSVLPSLQSPAQMLPPSGSYRRSHSVGSDCTSLELFQHFIFLMEYWVVSTLCMSET